MKLSRLFYRYFTGLPVKQQLITIIFAITFSCLIFACAAFIYYDRGAYRQDVMYNTHVLTRVVANHSSVALARRDSAALRNNLESLAVDVSVTFACVADKANTLRVVYLRDVQAAGSQLPVSCAEARNMLRHVSGAYLDITEPVIGEGSIALGDLYIRKDMQSVNQRLLVYSAVMIVVISLISIIAVVLSSRLQSLISAPLIALTEIADSITRKRNYSLRAESDRDDEIGRLVHSFNSMLEAIEEKNSAAMRTTEHLEVDVEKRTYALQQANRELEAFTYSVSHDLRAPLRAIDGFSLAMEEECLDQLDQHGRDYLARIRAASQHMNSLINSLLFLSKVARQELRLRNVDLAVLARETVERLVPHYAHQVIFVAPESLPAQGDPELLRVVIDNLLGNAWKYTARHPNARVELGSMIREGHAVFFVCDNGAGFDMKYAEVLFDPFQRQHHSADYEGLGIGLATVKRIVLRHAGEIWAEGEVDGGAIFYFTLGDGVGQNI